MMRCLRLCTLLAFIGILPTQPVLAIELSDAKTETALMPKTQTDLRKSWAGKAIIELNRLDSPFT